MQSPAEKMAELRHKEGAKVEDKKEKKKREDNRKWRRKKRAYRARNYGRGAEIFSRKIFEREEVERQGQNER